MIRALITPTPLMADFEHRFRMYIVIKVQSGDPLGDEIESLLYANITLSATLQWKVQRLNASGFFVHCHNQARLNEVLSKRGMVSDDFYVTFSQWSGKYGALKVNEMPSIWIRLFNFPFHSWLRSGFQNLVRAFGYLQEVDKSTITQERREFARIRVGCENFSDIPSMVQAEFEGEFYDVKVIVEKKKNVSFGKVLTLRRKSAQMIEKR